MSKIDYGGFTLLAYNYRNFVAAAAPLVLLHQMGRYIFSLLTRIRALIDKILRYRPISAGRR